MGDELDSIVENLHSIAIAEIKTGCFEKQLHKFYVENYGEAPPYRQHGFNTLGDLLRSRPDRFQLKNGAWHAQLTAETANIAYEIAAATGNGKRDRGSRGGRGTSVRGRGAPRGSVGGYGAAFGRGGGFAPRGGGFRGSAFNTGPSRSTSNFGTSRGGGPTPLFSAPMSRSKSFGRLPNPDDEDEDALWDRRGAGAKRGSTDTRRYDDDYRDDRRYDDGPAMRENNRYLARDQRSDDGYERYDRDRRPASPARSRGYSRDDYDSRSNYSDDRRPRDNNYDNYEGRRGIDDDYRRPDYAQSDRGSDRGLNLRYERARTPSPPPRPQYNEYDNRSKVSDDYVRAEDRVPPREDQYQPRSVTPPHMMAPPPLKAELPWDGPPHMRNMYGDPPGLKPPAIPRNSLPDIPPPGFEHVPSAIPPPPPQPAAAPPAPKSEAPAPPKAINYTTRVVMAEIASIFDYHPQPIPLNEVELHLLKNNKELLVKAIKNKTNTVDAFVKHYIAKADNRLYIRDNLLYADGPLACAPSPPSSVVSSNQTVAQSSSISTAETVNPVKVYPKDAPHAWLDFYAELHKLISKLSERERSGVVAFTTVKDAAPAVPSDVWVAFATVLCMPQKGRVPKGIHRSFFMDVSLVPSTICAIDDEPNEEILQEALQHHPELFLRQFPPPSLVQSSGQSQLQQPTPSPISSALSRPTPLYPTPPYPTPPLPSQSMTSPPPVLPPHQQPPSQHISPSTSSTLVVGPPTGNLGNWRMDAAPPSVAALPQRVSVYDDYASDRATLNRERFSQRETSPPPPPPRGQIPNESLYRSPPPSVSNVVLPRIHAFNFKHQLQMHRDDWYQAERKHVCIVGSQWDMRYKFHVLLEYDCPRYEEIKKQLSEVWRPPPPKLSWRRGDAAIFRERESFYRVSLISDPDLSDNKVNVQLVDLGDEELVDLDALYPLPDFLLASACALPIRFRPFEVTYEEGYQRLLDDIKNASPFTLEICLIDNVWPDDESLDCRLRFNNLTLPSSLVSQRIVRYL